MRIITLDSNKVITSVKDVGDNYVLGTNDLISDIGEIGQIQQNDGSFITPTLVVSTPQPSLEDKVNYLYYKSKGVI